LVAWAYDDPCTALALRIFGPPTAEFGVVWWAAVFDSWGWALLAGLTAYVGYRMSLPDAAAVLAADPRPPVLYLRSFADDLSNNLNPHGGLAYLLGITRPWGFWRVLVPLFSLYPLRLWKLVAGIAHDSSEEQLASYFGHVGPFVAIGRPGERVRLGGAYRVYLRDDEWQGWVLRQMERAACVILQPAETEGVFWEVAQAARRVAPHKLVISLLAFHNHRRRSFRLDEVGFEQARWDAVRSRADALFPRGLPERPDKAQFVCFDADGTPQLVGPRYRSPFLWPFVGVAVDLPGMFDGFAERLRAPANPLALRPARMRWLERAAAVACFVGPFVLVYLWFVWFSPRPPAYYTLSREDRERLHRVEEIASLAEPELVVPKTEAVRRVDEMLARTERERTRLHKAIRFDDLSVIRKLLDEGEAVNQEDEIYGTPLISALGNRRLDVARLLADRGADVHARSQSGTSTLTAAAGTGSLDAVQWVLDRGLSSRRTTTCRYWYPAPPRPTPGYCVPSSAWASTRTWATRTPGVPPSISQPRRGGRST
jgi:hypothetical protein